MPIYDLENRFSYYKSYSDNILVGPARPTMGSSTWQRSVSGSIVSGSEEWRASTLLSDYVFKKENPFFRSGEVRYLRLSSNSQTIKDSIAPDLLGIYMTGSLGSGSVAGNFLVTDLLSAEALFSADRKAITGSNGQRVNNIEWADSYPFEKKYYKVLPSSNVATYENVIKYERVFPYLPVDRYAAASVSSKTTPVPIGRLVFVITRVDGVNKMLSQSIDQQGYVNNAGSFIGGSGLVESKISESRGFFGINPKVLLFGSPETPSGQIYNPVDITGFTAEGWKYGLYNGLPTNFSAVFRQNHYGQFRDMLEQRIYTKTYNNPLIGGPMDNNGGINFISGSALLGESNDYITASIYASDNVTEAYRVNPYGSGIFDKEYRASQPWYDNDPRAWT